METNNTATTITIGGQTLNLLPQRAVFWREEATLFVADVHLGKPDAFVQAGIPVPTRVNLADLERLLAVVRQTGARHLVILGDFLHARASLSPGVVDALGAWREQCCTVAVTLIAGNHDLYAGPPPDHLDIAWCDESVLGPFRCLHIPPDAHAPDESIALCGHLHPYAVVAGKTREAVRLPCFHLGPRQLVLPAFGRFTGGHTVARRPGERVFVIAGDAVIEPHARREWMGTR